MNAVSPITILLMLSVALLAIVLALRCARRVIRWRSKALSDQQRLDLLYRHGTDGIVIGNHLGEIEWANDAFCELLGRRLDDVLGRNPHEYFASPESGSEHTMPESTLGIEAWDRQLLTYRSTSGEQLWVDTSSSKTRMSETGEVKYLMICRDITEAMKQREDLKKAQVELKHLSRSDVLTDISNRHGLFETLGTHAIAGNVSVAQIDIDRFKEINELHGSRGGDAVLIRIGEILCDLAGTNVHVARLGGDEFVVATTTMESDRLLMGAVSAFQRRLREPITWNGNVIRITANIGIATSDKQCHSAEELVSRSDFALLASRNRGLGQIAIYDQHLHDTHMTETRMMTELRSESALDQMEVFLQPIVETGTGEIWGHEALLRWRHPERGILGPGQFLDAARKAGRMRDVDLKSHELAIEALAHVQRNHSGPGPCPVITLNASSEVLLAPQFQERLNWACDLHDLNRSDVVVEVHETTVIEGPDSPVSERISALKAAGYRVLLDDFGVGQAGLYHLSNLDIYGIKLDRSLITDLPKNPASKSIVQSILSLCSELGMNVIAEGIETAEERALLNQFGCPMIQGYLVAKPMALPSLDVWVKMNARVDDRSMNMGA